MNQQVDRLLDTLKKYKLEPNFQIGTMANVLVLPKKWAKKWKK